MHEHILTLAAVLSGADENDWTLLEPICTALESAWLARLKDGVSPETCQDAFDCAVAFSAAAVFSAGNAGLDSFSAGDVSVKIRQDAQGQNALSAAAERLMAPYVLPDGLFLKGVTG